MSPVTDIVQIAAFFMAGLTGITALGLAVSYRRRNLPQPKPATVSVRHHARNPAR